MLSFIIIAMINNLLSYHVRDTNEITFVQKKITFEIQRKEKN